MSMHACMHNDRGYINTSAVKSAISYIDGDKGILRYRGYPIEQLAERSNFTEVLDTCCALIASALWCITPGAEHTHASMTAMAHGAGG